MAVSANYKRLNKEKILRNGLKKNCKWTWGRECSAQEKGDFLTYFLTN